MPNVTLLTAVPSQEPGEHERKEHKVGDGNEKNVVFGFGDIRSQTELRVFHRAPVADYGHT
jgi:hypothetical protein